MEGITNQEFYGDYSSPTVDKAVKV